VPSTIEEVLGLRAEAKGAFDLLWDGLYDPSRLDPRLTELCRLRVAQLVRADAELVRREPAAVAAGLSEDDVAALSSWPTSERFGPAERAALAYAELFVMDPSSVTDELAADVLEHLGAPGAAALSIALSTFDARARTCVALGIGTGPVASSSGASG
jgi:alkylhydroperoxidase family enzyme